MKGLKLAPYLFMGLVLAARCAVAVDCSLQSPGFPISNGAGFNLFSSNFTLAELNAGIAPWSSCGHYGTELPGLWIGGSGGIPVTITRVNGLSTEPSGGCGQSSVQPSNNQVVSATITIWTHQANGTPCAPLSDVISHELGHVYGLGDNGHPDCRGHVMGARTAGGTRSVYADDCDMADDMWEVPFEGYYDPNCDAFCTQGCVNGQCPTPIVVDLDGNGFHLSGPDDPVEFDIDADGIEETTSWTSPDQRDGFLALDRNGNGLIDDATELFGNSTPLADGGTAYNGYIPLRELDGLALGGNGDGYLDQRDAIFGSLLIWLDMNHNGVSEALEISTLEQAGVIRLALEYTTNKRRDRHGNQLRFQSKAWVRSASGRERLIHTMDVVFRESGL